MIYTSYHPSFHKRSSYRCDRKRLRPTFTFSGTKDRFLTNCAYCDLLTREGSVDVYCSTLSTATLVHASIMLPTVHIVRVTVRCLSSCFTKCVQMVNVHKRHVTMSLFMSTKHVNWRGWPCRSSVLLCLLMILFGVQQ